MKVNLDNAPPKITKSGYGVEVGNVYKNLRGMIYIIASVRERPDSFDGDKASAFVVDSEGEITNVVMYSTYYFSRFTCLGRALNLPGEIEIEWID